MLVYQSNVNTLPEILHTEDPKLLQAVRKYRETPSKRQGSSAETLSKHCYMIIPNTTKRTVAPTKGMAMYGSAHLA